jgi:hypothetical protein
MSHKFLNINWELYDRKKEESKQKLDRLLQQNNNINNNVTTITYDRPLTYFLPPPVINSTFVYQDVNKDPQLRYEVTNFFVNKTIKWIKEYNEFKNVKHLLVKLKTNVGYELIHNILRQFIKKNNCNWYDLRNNYELVKDFIRFRLNK